MGEKTAERKAAIRNKAIGISKGVLLIFTDFSTRINMQESKRSKKTVIPKRVIFVKTIGLVEIVVKATGKNIRNTPSKKRAKLRTK